MNGCEYGGRCGRNAFCGAGEQVGPAEAADSAQACITAADIAGAVRLIPEGMVALTTELTCYLAKRYGSQSVTFRGPMCCIRESGTGEAVDEVPYWRLLNPKGCVITRRWFMPNSAQMERLDREGHSLLRDRRNRVRVLDYKDKLYHFQ